MLELAAPLEVVTRRKLEPRRHQPAGVPDETREVATANVRLDDDTPRELLAADLGRPFGEGDVGELREGNEAVAKPTAPQPEENSTW
jgi:hypothetical protein